MKSYWLILFAFLVASSSIQAQSDDEEFESERAFFMLRFDGKIINEGIKFKEVTATLYNENRKVETVTIENNGNIPLHLSSGRRYMIEIKCPGYFVHRIGINTEIDKAKREIPPFEFFIKLVEIDKEDEDQQEVEDDLIDFPAALISFNEKRQKFTYDREYSKQFKLERKNAGIR